MYNKKPVDKKHGPNKKKGSGNKMSSCNESMDEVETEENTSCENMDTSTSEEISESETGKNKSLVQPYYQPTQCVSQNKD